MPGNDDILILDGDRVRFTLSKDAAIKLMQAELEVLRQNAPAANGHAVDHGARIYAAKAIIAELEQNTRKARVVGLGTLRPYMDRILAALDGKS